LNAVDAKIKVKYSRPKTGQYRSGYDPINIELLFVNEFKKDENNWLSMPSGDLKSEKPKS
jgi:hypothetical protein